MSSEVVEVFVPCGGSTSEARADAEKQHPGATVYVFTETDRIFLNPKLLRKRAS